MTTTKIFSVQEETRQSCLKYNKLIIKNLNIDEKYYILSKNYIMLTYPKNKKCIK